MSRRLAEPSCHSYLGDSLRDTKTRQRIEVNLDKIYDILLVPLADVVLFPCETIPLRLQDQNLVNQIKHIVQTSDLLGQEGSDQLIGVVNIGYNRRNTSLSKFGTTVEIKASHCGRMDTQYSHNDSNAEEVILTGKGRYRFQILKVRTAERGVIFAQARLLKDSRIAHFPVRPELDSFPHWVSVVNSPPMLAKTAYKLVETSFFWTTDSSTALQRWGPLSSRALVTTTSATTRATQRVSPKRTRTQLNDTDIPKIPDFYTNKEERYGSLSYVYGAELDPVGFSYFLAANLPVPTEKLQGLLEAPEVVQRLRLCIRLLEDGAGKVLACAACRLPLAAKQQVFTVPGAEGVTGAYVNPHGAVHQTITVRKLQTSRCVLLHGAPTVQDSWFPGYAWTIASCARCLSHLGWRFTLAEPNPHSWRALVSAGLRTFNIQELVQLVRGGAERAREDDGPHSEDRSSDNSQSADMEGSSEEEEEDSEDSDNSSDSSSSTGSSEVSAQEGSDESGSEMYDDTMEWLGSADEAEEEEVGDGFEEQAESVLASSADPSQSGPTEPPVPVAAVEEERVAMFWGLRRSSLIEV